MKEGPTEVKYYTCVGCPALKTEYWKDYLENDETDSGTRADCTKADKFISVYYRPTDKTPDWCPILSPSEEG